jgi:16S rRNA (guanine527-N7)-methyltransferase
VSFEQSLSQVLPQDLPHRDELITKGARHLELVVEANKIMNLTRIVDPQEAAVKHVLDSVTPWRRLADGKTVLDAGTGAGFPGIPLAIVMPHVHFVLSESIQKKARFVSSVVETLGLANVTVTAERAESFLGKKHAQVVLARAVAPIAKALELFAPAIKKGTLLLLYKGPDVATEIEEAQALLKRARISARIVERYELPNEMGARTLVELAAVR